MAVVSPMSPAMATTPHQVYPTTPLRGSEVPLIMSGLREAAEASSPNVVDDIIHVAVAKDVKDSRLNLIWAIQNSGGKRICILYVHVPAATIPIMGANFPESAAGEHRVQEHRENEEQGMRNILNDYLLICRRMGVEAEKLHIVDKDCIEKGIVELICKHNIKKLVMGAASDKYHSRRMTELRSRKAIYVRENAPAYCHIQFICKGYLIYTRNLSLDGGNVEVRSPLAPQTPSRSPSLGQQLYRRVRSVNERNGGRMSLASPIRFLMQPNRFGREGTSNGSDVLSRPASPLVSSRSSVNFISEPSENASALNSSSPNAIQASPSRLQDSEMDETLYDQLQQAMAEAENARQDAYQESIRRGNAERNAIEAIRRAKAAEMKYEKEVKLRKELEEAIKREKEEIDCMKSQREKLNEELQHALHKNSLLESKIASTQLMLEELDQKNKSAMDTLEKYKQEREDLQTQRDNALKEAEELRREKQGEASTSHVFQLFSEFSFAEIKEATNNFSPSQKIGEGGYGSIYKGILRQTEVAVKMLSPDSKQGPKEFQQEVEVLSKLRHPNLITLIGTCPESWTLVYEYLSNGSLEDRLSCEDNTPPLSWQTRIRIAAEVCSTLVCLHSNKPHSIVHGDLKPANILLDANLVSKLSDFGISRLLSCREDSTTQFWITDPKGTFAYMDPEFFASGELTPKSDVYSFGIILLKLLTGKPAVGIAKVVESALVAGKLNSLLDPLAGDWPLALAEKLARLALRCCEMERRNRPDLHLEVWRILEPMKASLSGENTLGLGSQELCQPPPYFICPIFKEVMRDPHMAADGHTYEAEAIRGWLDSGRDTSPVTNSKLVMHNLVPNHALRYAIQDWLES
ncbi:U-box domain-containing protein 33 isoform X1 [Arachis ipaensis]|uniref:U-box domain-containing protein 33 isoform X1 n=1 Tax=Arachis ipaensis TaxID=130454 RepID=UPI0007AF5D81|nr:U-box domain-containing protein 33 isoform X1 [Arachis ipaensis]